MSLDLRGPDGEAEIQAIERLVALKNSYHYAGGGSYDGGPNGWGCDSDDMADIDSEIACFAMEALPLIREMQAAQVHRSHLLEAVNDQGCARLSIASLHAIVNQLHQGFDNGGLDRGDFARFLSSLADRLTSIVDISEMKLEGQQ